ncbi:spc97 spc98 family [Trichoderma arundinaceum]|uniref:Spindle pole body component n=1 Tax=Trichoderma arundinaceum TaxID=490622 RepID=A0A395NNC2_TRIAR|nr:spc97 spc98 family [Trichoderma arundinaceum]
MLHEILLSLSGHPSPLLRAGTADSGTVSGVTPSERQLLASAAHLSDIHIKLIKYAGQTAGAHPSPICRAVGTAIQSIHLSAFQRKVLEVEESILKEDPELVGEYNIVPLTAVMGEFTQWTRRFEWLWDIVQFMMTKDDKGSACRGSQIMNRLRTELLSGYRDVEEAAMSLVKVAETAWLKQVSAWVLYGRLPNLGGNDFFIQKVDGTAEYIYEPELLPGFVTPSTATSMLFIGKSLNHTRVRATVDSGMGGLDHLSTKLQELASLSFPVNSATFSRTIVSIRLSLSQNTLQKILPTAKVIETLQLLREFFLLGRGEFAMALTQEADDRIRNRWRRAGNLAHEKEDGMKNLTVKDGEVSAVLARTWAVLVAMQRNQVEEDELLELARDLLRLHLTKANLTPVSVSPGINAEEAKLVAASPFRNLLFSVPATLSIQLPSPLDMVISPSDLQLYSCINSYLLSMRRAHIRLTDLWKITSLRRHHPAPRGANEYAGVLRERWSARSAALRSSWTTASAAIFFLGETEAYFQTEIVEGLWEGFLTWLTGKDRRREGGRSGAATPAAHSAKHSIATTDWRPGSSSNATNPNDVSKLLSRPAPDPQTLTTAHSLYLRTLVHRLLLTQPTFTNLLYNLLNHIDHLVTHIQRLHSIFTSIDLETDAGVLDSSADLDREEQHIMSLIRGVEGKIRQGIEDVVAALRALENDIEFLARWEGLDGTVDGQEEYGDGEKYIPVRVGGINRLLMKLDFGTWISTQGYM